ncbi:MAG: glycoside hydrolase family 5 protein [Spirochaetales bacterium]|nr:glycoside hydrolase family 5 protein [Spirochaetales bacterium]
MKNIFIYSILAVVLPLLFLGCPLSSSGECEFTYVADENRAVRPLSGINLGNALEAPNEGEWGVILQAEYFTIIRNAGFNYLRIPIRWSNHAADDPPYTIDAGFLARVDWAVNEALTEGFITIINIHHYEEIMSDPAGHKDRFLALWSQIADHFKDYSANLYFEILNEPNDQLTTALWNQYLNEAITLIRGSGGSNDTRKLIVGTANWGGISSLNDLTIPTAAQDANIIVTIHYYSPFQFTHQGAEWVTGSDAWLGTTWTGTAAETAAVQSDFNAVKDWADNHNRQIFLGEFGAYSAADNCSRITWTEYIVEQAEARDFIWAYWEFCAGFGVYNRDILAGAWCEELLDALIPE